MKEVIPEIVVPEGNDDRKPVTENIVIISPKWTKCELAFHFVLDFNDSNTDIMRLICRDYPLKQRDVFDVLPDWRRGLFFKVKKCANI